MTRRTHPWGPLAVGLVALALPACDNPACVFGPNGCQKKAADDEGTSAPPAGVPVNGAWIVDGAATVVDMFPQGADAHPETPIVITFSESLSGATVNEGFELVDITLGDQVLPVIQPVPLVGDGRMVVLAPVAPLPVDHSFVVRFAQDAQVRDLTGQLVVQGTSSDIGSFAVAPTPPTTPDVIATWPADFSDGQSDIGEIVVVFDRPMDPSTFDTSSFAVTVNSLTPPQNPAPTPLIVLGNLFPIPINSVWRWASVDGDGARVSLGASGMVRVDLSPAGNELRDEDGTPLPPTVLEYDIANVAVPAFARKGALSNPSDAIGRPNLSDVVPVLEVELSDFAQAGDSLLLTLVGTGPASGDPLRAHSRVVNVVASTLLIDVLPGSLALLDGASGIFADGTLHVAVSLRRGTLQTAVRMVDVEPADAGVQPLLFDVTAPVVLGLGTSGSVTATFRSDLRDLVIVGRGNEEIRRVEVSTDTALDNGVDPDAILAHPNGLFAAAPVVLPGGVLDPRDLPLQYTVRVFDRALNPQAGTTVGLFTQVGTVGPGAAVPVSMPIDVFVFDEGTLAPIAGAQVFSFEDTAPVFTYLDDMFTDAAGHAQVMSGAAGTETLITVDQTGYDLVTFHGIPRDVIQIGLRPTNQADATTQGDVQSPFPTANIQTETNQIGDSRRADDQERLFPVSSCSINAQALVYNCPFGPEDVLPRRMGAQGFLAADFGVSLGSFTAAAFLKAYVARLPIPPLAPGGLEDELLSVEDLLINLDPEEQAIATLPTILVDDDTLDLGALSFDPVVTVDGVSPGLTGSVTVGIGKPFDVGGGDWAVLAAYSGLADGIDDGGGDVLGELVTQGTIRADLLLRAEMVGLGGRTGVRRTLSTLGGAVLPLNVPRLVLPPPGGNTGGRSFTLAACDPLPDSAGMAGLFRFELTDASGRRWVLWRRDLAGGGAACPSRVSVHASDIGPFGGTPLADGALTCRISVFGWPGLDPNAFLWTDVGREQELFAHSALIALTQP